VLDVGPDPATKRGRGPTFKFWDTPHISRMAEDRGLKFYVRTGGGGPNENYAKAGHRMSGTGSRDLNLNFGILLVSPEG